MIARLYPETARAAATAREDTRVRTQRDYRFQVRRSADSLSLAPRRAPPRATGCVNYPWARPDAPRDQGSSDPSIPVAAASCADPGPMGFMGNIHSLRRETIQC